MAKIAVIGCGLIGASWAALGASHGYSVAAFDPTPERRGELPGVVERLRGQLAELRADRGGLVTLAASAEEAVAGADIVQECAPEQLALKVDLLARLDRAAPAGAIIATSTSSLLLSEMRAACSRPERVIVAHPFNPPHLMPLVELFATDATILARAESFYRSLGKHTICLRREMPGHIANRLGAALWQEAVYLLAEGVADVADIDAALVHGPAMRWAAMGANLTYHLGGGAGGIRHYLEHLGPSQERRWASLGRVRLTPETQAALIAGVEAAAAGRSIAELEAERDRFLIDILRLRGHVS